MNDNLCSEQSERKKERKKREKQESNMNPEIPSDRKSLEENGYKFSKALTEAVIPEFAGEIITISLINKIISTIKENRYARNSDDIRIGYEKQNLNGSTLVTYGIFIKPTDKKKEAINISMEISESIPEDKVLNPYIERMLVEREDLLIKLEKLIIFIEGENPIFKNLDIIDQDLLIEQYIYMLNYYLVLNKRLDRTKKDLTYSLRESTADLMFDKYLNKTKLETTC